MKVFEIIKSIFAELREISSLSAERKLFLIAGALVIFLGWTSYTFYNKAEQKHKICDEKIDLAIDKLKTKYNSYIIECGEDRMTMQQTHLKEIDSLIRINNSNIVMLDLIDKRLKKVEEANKELELKIQNMLK